MRSALFSILLILSSCSFEQVISLDTLHEPQMAITARLSNQDSLYQIFISETLSINDTNSYKVLEDVDLFLDYNDLVTHSFSYNGSAQYYELPKQSFDLKTGDQFQLLADHPRFGAAIAKQTVPAPVSNYTISDTLIFQEPKTTFWEGEIALDLEVEADTKRYYILQGEAFGKDRGLFDTISTKSPLLLRSEATWIEYNGLTRIFFQDDNLNASQVTLELDVISTLLSIESLSFQIISCTREAYLHELSVDRYEENNGSALGEPITLVSNIDNGVGVFGIYFIENIQLIY